MSKSAPARLRVALAAVLVAAGCSGVQVRQVKCLVALRDRATRLIDSHSVSAFTADVLRQHGLSAHTAKHDPGDAARVLEAGGGDPTPELALALAELCFRAARKVDDLSPAPSLAWYRDSAVWAARATASGDPDLIAEATVFHNRSVERLVRLSQDRRLRRGRDWPAVFADAGIALAGDHPFLDPPRYADLTVAADIFSRGMPTWYADDGYGVPVIAFRDNDRTGSPDPTDRFFPLHVRAGATAVLHPSPGFAGEGPGVREPGRPTLVFHDPFEERVVAPAGAAVPMATDRTAALAAHVSWAYVQTLARLGIRRPQALEAETGLHMFRPYQPGKVPVILIHGLRSTPNAAWVQTLNLLQNDPDLAGRCQFWLYLYPTGAPLASNAARLRSELRAALATFDPGGSDPALRQMVLVGHSMGGLISKLAAQDSGRAVWDSVFTVGPDDLRVSAVSRQVLVERLFFRPEPAIGRLVFVATPHRGSELANRPVGRLLESKVVRDDPFQAAVHEAVKQNGRRVLAPGVKVRRMDGVGGLRPNDPILGATADLPTPPPHHTIVPLIGTEDVLSTDLVVKYRSSHLDTAESELIVPGIHVTTDTPRVAAEVKRILLEHLAGLDGGGGQTP